MLLLLVATCRQTPTGNLEHKRAMCVSLAHSLSAHRHNRIYTLAHTHTHTHTRSLERSDDRLDFTMIHHFGSRRHPSRQIISYHPISYPILNYLIPSSQPSSSNHATRARLACFAANSQSLQLSANELACATKLQHSDVF